MSGIGSFKSSFDEVTTTGYKQHHRQDQVTRMKFARFPQRNRVLEEIRALAGLPQHRWDGPEGSRRVTEFRGRAGGGGLSNLCIQCRERVTKVVCCSAATSFTMAGDRAFILESRDVRTRR